MIRGRHTFVWGGQLEEGYDNYLQTNTGGGLISFTDRGHQQPSAQERGNVRPEDIDFADFLLGYGMGQGAAFGNQTTGSLVISGPVSGKQTYRAFYFGDNWHVTSKLTVNLGLRYELQGPWSERFDKMTYFDPQATNTSVTGCSGVAGSACPGDVFLVKTGVNDTGTTCRFRRRNSCRGLDLPIASDQKTVIRGGYGIFFIPNYVSFGTPTPTSIRSAARPRTSSPATTTAVTPAAP